MESRKELSVVEMQNLINSGIDVSNASLCWVKVESNEEDEQYIWSLEIMNNDHRTKIQNNNPCYVPAYTLDDIYDKLPQYIQPFLNRPAAKANGCDEDKWVLKCSYMLGADYASVRYVRNDYVPENNGYCGNEYHRDDIYLSIIGKTRIEAAYKMLCACIKDKFVTK